MRGIKKISVLISCLMITIILLCSCGFEKKIPKELQLSEGMEKLAQKTIDSFDGYMSADKSKKSYLKSVYNAHEQKEDITSASSVKLGDFIMDDLIDELYENSINEYVKKDDLEITVKDMRAVLDGTYNYKKEKYDKLYENEDLLFYLNSKWEPKDKKEYFSYTNKSGYYLYLQPEHSSLTEDLLSQKDKGLEDVCLPYLLDSDKMKYSNIYKSRKLNFFNIYTGTYDDDGDKFNVLVAATDKLNTSNSSYLLSDYDNYMFCFYSVDKLPKSMIYDILDHVESTESDTIYDIDDKYEEYFEKH